MSQMSNYLEVELRKHLFRTGSFTKPAALYVSLHTADPTDAGTGTEVSGVGYAREQRDPGDANWSAASATDGITKNVAEVDFGIAGAGGWGLITHFGVWDAASGGNLICFGALTASKTVNEGDSFKFPADAIVITFA